MVFFHCSLKMKMKNLNNKIFLTTFILNIKTCRKIKLKEQGKRVKAKYTYC